MADTGVLLIKSLDKGFVIHGDTIKILQNRFAMMYLRRNLHHSVSGVDIVIEDVTDINTIMSHVSVLAKYGKCEIHFDENVSEEIKAYEDREQSFAEFSKKAKDIRENHPVVSEFEDFKESLIKNMQARRLYTLQMLSAYHMAFAQNACNFSVPGAGKTSIVYGAYAYLKHLPESNPKHVDKLLIIGPLSSFGPWEHEYQECFGRKVESMRLVGGLSKEKKSLYLHGIDTCELTIASYQSVISIKDDLCFFLSRNKVMVVLDEAHKIKNTQGAITAASTMELAKLATSRVVLTGTPAPNGYEDLYNLFKFIWPDRDIISYNVAQLSNMSANSDDNRIPDLIERISPFFIRIKKSDLNIPPATYKEIPVPMSDTQRIVYDTIENKLMQSFDEDNDSPYLKKIRQAKMIRLMQAATNPELLRHSFNGAFDEDGNPIVESKEDSIFIGNILQFVGNEMPNKFIKACEIVKDIISQGGKVVIWASFIRNIEKMSQCLSDMGIPSKSLYGVTPVETADDEFESQMETREFIVREFNSDNSSFNVIIANPSAVAESISLHKKCHNAIYLERSFNAAHFIQSKDRIHRYGLPEDTITTYYYLISENSIDETINSRLQLKEKRLNQIMESMPIPLFDNNLEEGGIDDIKAIIYDYAQRAKKI